MEICVCDSFVREVYPTGEIDGGCCSGCCCCGGGGGIGKY